MGGHCAKTEGLKGVDEQIDITDRKTLLKLLQTLHRAKA